MMEDIIMLAVIFGALVAVCLVLTYLNNREDRSYMCEVCGGDEFLDVVPGNGLIENRMVMRCHDCKRTREIRDGDL